MIALTSVTVKRLLILLLAMQLAGCTAMSTIMALPATLFDSAVYLVRGEEASFPMDMKRTLAVAQLGLNTISMPANLVQANGEGYRIRFGEPPFSGAMELKRETATLSSVYIKVRKGVSRMDAIEQTLLEEMRKQARSLPRRATFDNSGYVRLFSQPDKKSEFIGWLRLKWQSDAQPAKATGWRKVKVAAGQIGYFTRK